MGRSTEDYLDSLLMEAMASEENDIYEELGEDEPVHTRDRFALLDDAGRAGRGIRRYKTAVSLIP